MIANSLRTLIFATMLTAALPIQAGSVQAHLQGGPSEVIMFTLPDCAYCKSAKSLMTRKHIPFREVDLTTEEGMRLAETLRVPAMAPVFSYRNRVMQGYSEERLLKFVEN